MMPVVHETLLWGCRLGVPILIHLINMMRHRRVRGRPWSFCWSARRGTAPGSAQQLLLLLLRIAAVAAVVLMLAQPLRNRWGRLLGAPKRNTSCCSTIASRCPTAGPRPPPSNEATSHRPDRRTGRPPDPAIFTLLRFSQAGNGSREHPARSARGAVRRRIRRAAEHAARRIAPVANRGRAHRGPRCDRSPGKKQDFEDRVIYLITDFAPPNGTIRPSSASRCSVCTMPVPSRSWSTALTRCIPIWPWPA